MTAKEYKKAFLEYLEAAQREFPEGDTLYAMGFHDGIDWVHEKVAWDVIEIGKEESKTMTEHETKYRRIAEYLKEVASSDPNSIESELERIAARERKIMALEMMIRFGTLDVAPLD